MFQPPLTSLLLGLSVHKPLPLEVAEAVGHRCVWEGEAHQEGPAQRCRPPTLQAPQRQAGQVEEQSPVDRGGPGG